MPQRKILIVENDFILYDELCEFFEEKGFAIVKGEEETAVDNYDTAVKLVRQHKPDIAILDIRIEGDKDGIDIGNFIKQHYHIPVIYLSAHPNPENLERIRKTGGERFMLKASKPLNKEQLWSMFYLALPEADVHIKEKSLGKFFSVKEMQIKKSENRRQIIGKSSTDPLEIQTFLKWDNIVFIESYNAKTAGSGNNNMLMHTVEQGKAYMLRGALSELETQLPAHFRRFDQSTILNVHKITGHIKGTSVYLIGDLEFKLSSTYKDKNGNKDFPFFE